MKRFVLVFLCAVLAFTAVACDDSEFHVGDLQKNEENTEKKNYERVDTQEFMNALLDAYDAKTVKVDGVSKDDLDIKKCAEVTPEGVFEATGVQLFKFADNFASFMIKDGEIKEACYSFGGSGFSDAIPWDYDQNGVDDLLVAGSWGSGMHRAALTLWNMDTMEQIDLGAMNIQSSFFFMGDIGLDFIDENDPSKGIVIYAISYTQVRDEENQSVDFIASRGTDMAEIRMENGVFVYVPLTDSLL